MRRWRAQRKRKRNLYKKNWKETIRMSRIETEIWEPHPEKKGMVRYVGQRKTGDIFRDVEMFLK